MTIRNKHRYAPPPPDYTPRDALESIAFTDNGSDKLAALFSPWHRADRFYQKLADKLQSQGYDIVRYTLSPGVLQPNAAEVVASYHSAADSITRDLQQRLQAKQYNYLHLVGTSIGNLPVVMLAGQLPGINEITMAAVASNLAKCMWEGIRTRDLRDAFTHAGLTEEQLSAQWHSLAPISYVPHLAGKKVNLLIAKKDLVIPTRYQMEFYAALASVNEQLHVKFCRTGHYASILRYCLTGKV